MSCSDHRLSRILVSHLSHPEADSHRGEGMLIQAEYFHLSNGSTHALAEVLGSGSIEFRQQSHELVLSIARQHLTWTRAFSKS